MRVDSSDYDIRNRGYNPQDDVKRQTVAEKDNVGIPQKILQLEGSISSLYEVITTLEQKLRPILIEPRPTCEEKAEARIAEFSPTYYQIEELTERVYNAARRVMAITDRADL